LKVAFDEHVPTALAKVFISLAKERPIRRVSEGLIFEQAADYAPSTGDRDYVKKSDVPWLDRFAAAGGHAVISGDTKMRERVHERLALYNNGFVVIFFEAQWGSWNFFRKTALMVHWWEEITHKIKHTDKGTFWAVPSAWPTTTGQLRNISIGLAQLLKDKPQTAQTQRPRRQPHRRSPSARRTDGRQTGFFDEKEDKNGAPKK
jgi:hypothetical protein